MRWRIISKVSPKQGDIKYRYKFLWFPLRINNEVRWLETAHIMYEFEIYESYTTDTIGGKVEAIPYTVAHWIPVKFIMNDPVKECKVYKEDVCCHVDGPLCRLKMCKEYHISNSPSHSFTLWETELKLKDLKIINMPGDINYGKCQCCGKEAALERKYFYYDIDCECCGATYKGKKVHFQFVEHCSNCIPKAPEVIKVSLKLKPMN